jgi:7-cyano-7-deazaguanine synthase
MSDNKNGIAVVSGGLDSVTMLYSIAEVGFTPDVVSFNYDQRHKKELEFARDAAERLRLRWTEVDLHYYGQLLAESGSSLVDPDTKVPEGHYAHETMKKTVVPNRNMIMAAMATGLCIARGGKYVAMGPHNGDAAIYPDCRPKFWRMLEGTLRTANEGFLPTDFHLLLPFLNKSKADIAKEAGRLEVPISLTWSCYNGRALHCGRCGTCVERLEALDAAGINDPTRYEDADYWRTQINA